MTQDSAAPTPHVTRIARRRALPGHEQAYADLVRQMFASMKSHPGFLGPVVPATMHPPRARMAFVTWLGIWPTASAFIFFLAPWLTGLGLPFLIVTAVNTALITLVMIYLLMPRLTRLLRGFLNPSSN